MKGKTFGILVALAVAAALTVGVSVAAASGGGSWFHHTLSNGHAVCNQDNTSNPSPVDGGPFADKATCDAFTPSSGGGGGDQGPIVGWPSGSGTLSGTFTCSPVTITSADDANGFGAVDFDGPFGTFATLPIFSASDYTILAGTGAQSEPYLIVRFSDSTEVFVYATDVTGPGTRYSDDVNHNTYLTRAQALASYGTKQVSSVTLAVDNGDLSIEVNGVTPDNCGNLAALAPVNHMFLCYSTFQQDGGQVFTNTEALAILADPSMVGWTKAWAPFAVAGTDTTGAYPNVSGDHLVCNPPAALKPTGEWLYADNNGGAELAPFGPSVSGDAGYEVVK